MSGSGTVLSWFSSSPFSRPRGAGRGSWRERRAQTPLLQTPFPTCSPARPPTATNPGLERETSHLMTGDLRQGTVGVARNGRDCGGRAKVVYLIVWSRRPHSERRPLLRRCLRCRTERGQVASGHQLQPQPRLDKAASNRCVRDKGYTHGLWTKRRHPWGGRRVFIQIRDAPTLEF